MLTNRLRSQPLTVNRSWSLCHIERRERFVTVLLAVVRTEDRDWRTEPFQNLDDDDDDAGMISFCIRRLGPSSRWRSLVVVVVAVAESVVAVAAIEVWVVVPSRCRFRSNEDGFGICLYYSQCYTSLNHLSRVENIDILTNTRVYMCNARTCCNMMRVLQCCGLILFFGVCRTLYYRRNKWWVMRLQI